jgi:hypothetical protein
MRAEVKWEQVDMQPLEEVSSLCLWLLGLFTLSKQRAAVSLLVLVDQSVHWKE